MDLLAFEYLAQQITDESDDTSVYDYMKHCLDEELTEEESKKVMEMLNEVCDRIGRPTVTDVQQNLATYSIGASDEMKKFYRWLNGKLEKVVKGEWDEKQFREYWNLQAEKVVDKMNDKGTGLLNRLALANIIIMIEDIK